MNPEELDFWKAVYIASIVSGGSNSDAQYKADKAVEKLRERVPDGSNQA